MRRKHNPHLTPLAIDLRQNPTPEERHLWYDYLRNHPGRFIRQKVVGNYIVDFYSSSMKLVIEVDGSQHYEEEALRKDIERTAFLERYGLTVVRIPNREINLNFAGVCEYLDEMIRRAAAQTGKRRIGDGS